MVEKGNKGKTGVQGAILAICPLCKGAGEIPREVPLMANPRAPATRADRMGSKPCPKCEGRGRMGTE